MSYAPGVLVLFFAKNRMAAVILCLGVGFLAGTSPFGRKNTAAAAYFVLFLITLVAAVTGYFFFDLKVIGTMMCFFGLLLALEWIGLDFSATRRGLFRLLLLWVRCCMVLPCCLRRTVI